LRLPEEAKLQRFFVGKSQHTFDGFAAVLVGGIWDLSRDYLCSGATNGSGSGVPDQPGPLVRNQMWIRAWSVSQSIRQPSGGLFHEVTTSKFVP